VSKGGGKGEEKSPKGKLTEEGKHMKTWMVAPKVECNREERNKFWEREGKGQSPKSQLKKNLRKKQQIPCYKSPHSRKKKNFLLAENNQAQPVNQRRSSNYKKKDNQN